MNRSLLAVAITAALALAGVAVLTEMTVFAFVYLAVAILLLIVAAARGAALDPRVLIGVILVLLAAFADYGTKGYAYPGGPSIDQDAQAMMLFSGFLLALIGWGFLLRAAVRPGRVAGPT